MEGTYGCNMPTETNKHPVGTRLRTFGGTVVVAFAVTLAVMIGQRLSDQAMAVLAGAVCGVGASIPTSLLIVWVTQRRREPQPTRAMPGAYPPVVVVQPPLQPGAPGPATSHTGYPAPFAPPARREFTIVGSDAEEVGYGYSP